MKKVIETKNAPATLGQYSQAIKTGDIIFTAGQIALSPATGEFVADDIGGQTKQVLENLRAVLQEADADMHHVLKTTVYLTTPEHFKPMNEVYAQYFKETPPARSTVFVSSLPKGALVEIDVIARL